MSVTRSVDISEKIELIWFQVDHRYSLITDPYLTIRVRLAHLLVAEVGRQIKFEPRSALMFLALPLKLPITLRKL